MTRHAVPALKKSPNVSKMDFASLIARGARIHWARASLSVSGRRFVMEGPSGTHSMDMDLTSRDRLNAHWKAFALHVDNQFCG